MSRTAGQRERLMAGVMALLAVWAVIHAVVTGRSPLEVVLGVTVWTAFGILIAIQYRLLGRDGFYDSALYHRLLVCTAVLCCLPFAVRFFQDLSAHRSVSPWSFILFGWVALTIWSGFRRYRTAQAAQAAHQ